MTDKAFRQIIDSLDELLDQERQALLAGDLERIGRLLSLKENLIDRLNALQIIDADRLKLVQGKVNRNQTLLNSAMEGIQAVANRMAELRKVRQSLETYDQAGKRKQFRTRTNQKLEKRA